MGYVVFDLDQTLADISSVYLFLLTLTMYHYIEEDKPYMLSYFSDELKSQLEKAYELFVNRITKEEMSEHPLGILRPRILGIMRQINKMKSIIHSVTIYSNNRYLPSLLLVRDIIHRAIGNPIIDSCIHWNHPSRISDHETQPYITKSWGTLKSILIDQGAPLDLSPDHVLFFDDQDHIQLQTSLQVHYYKVPMYKTRDTFDRIAAIYISCIEEVNVNIYSIYLYLSEIMDEKMTHLDPSHFVISDLIRLIQKGSINTYPTEHCPIDYGIRIMKDALQDIMIQDRVMRGAKRCSRRKHRHTIKK